MTLWRQTMGTFINKKRNIGSSPIYVLGDIFFSSINREVDNPSFLIEISRKIIKKAADLLKPYGVTEELIQTYWPETNFPYLFDEFSLDALNYFITGSPVSDLDQKDYLNRNLEPLDKQYHLTTMGAIQEIRELDHNALDALKHLYKYGLRGEHLRMWRGDKNDAFFWHDHANALVSLMKDQACSAEDAMKKINGIDVTAAVEIWRTFYHSQQGRAATVLFSKK